MKICVTGHRPNKLYGYNLSDPRWQRLKEQFKSILKENNCEEAITGMALGVDTVFAFAVLELKNEGYDIRLHCAIPCKIIPVSGLKKVLNNTITFFLKQISSSWYLMKNISLG